MVYPKRLLATTILGIIFGLLCFAMATSGGADLALPVSVQIILSRSLIGFAIGISALHFFHWSLHGIIMGLIFSLPLAFSGLMEPMKAPSLVRL